MPSTGSVATASSVETATHDDPTAMLAKMATATTSAENPDSDVTVARARPDMASCNLASATTTAFSVSP